MKKTASQLRVAVAEHRAGNLDNAARLYQKILCRDARHPDALHLLGVLCAGTGQAAAAVSLIAEAIRAGGPRPEFCADLGRLFLRQTRFSEAAACFRQSLRADPLNVGVTFQLGRALAAQGLGAAASLAFEQVIALAPDFAEAHYNLGVLWTVEQRVGEAIDCYRRALALQPGHADAHNNLGILLHAGANAAEAERHYEAALRLRPADLYARYNLGRLYEDTGRYELALARYGEVLEARPEDVAARSNLGNCLYSLGQPRAAIEQQRRVLAADPEYIDAHWNLALALLQTGQWREGWQEYEWRFRHWPHLLRDFGKPRWDGRLLHGARLLLYAEQGFGDTLQFVRYARIARQRGGHVILECQPPLARLLRGVEGVDEVVARGCDLPPFDYHAPLLSLPRILAESAGVSAVVPYVRAESGLSEHWRDRLRTYGDGLRVGLVWSGNPLHKNDRNRSMPCAAWAGLRDAGAATFFSLQTGAESMREPDSLPVVCLGPELRDFADTAAVLKNLDLVITVDTAMSHLSGALAVPVWTLLPHVADWRWLEGGEESPWYPTMRLFRQPSAGAWDAVMTAVGQALKSQPRSREPDSG